MNKWVYTFGNGKAEGDASMRNLLGGKGANLAEMNKVGLPVPPGIYGNNRSLYILLQQRPLVSGRPEGSGSRSCGLC